MTSLDEHSVTVPAIGSQAQSSRKSLPHYSLSKVGRDQQFAVFISKEHQKTDKLGRQSPIGGPVYSLPSTLGKNTMVFPKSERPDILNTKPPDGLDSNAELQIHVDSQQFKYPRDATMLIGTEPRGRLKDAELIKNHSAAFFGRASPGPAAIGDEFGPQWKSTKPRFAPAGPFGEKVKLKKDWTMINDSPEEVGPGIYPRKDISIGQQHLSHRRNQPVNEFTKAPKFAKTRSADIVSKYDAARSCFGKQVLGKNRSEPSVGFGTGTRDRRARSALCMTNLDEGPKAVMPKLRCEMPKLPSEPVIMKCGYM